MREHGEKYSIEKIWKSYFIELDEYDNRLHNLQQKLERSNTNDVYLKYAKVRIKAHELLKELDWSKIMNDYKTHLAHLHLIIKSNLVSNLLIPYINFL